VDRSAGMQKIPNRLLDRLWFRFLLYWLFWTCLGLLNLSQTLYVRKVFGKPFHLFEATVIGLADWYIWAALAPIVVILGRRYPLEQRRWLLHVPLHLVFSVVAAMITTILVYPIVIWLNSFWELPGTTIGRVKFLFVREAHLYLWVYWAVLGVGHALDFHRKYREQELSAAKLEARLAQAQLQVLKMQLDPHFLFNTLHAVTALVYKRPAAAETVVARLSEMLRMSLESQETQEIPLRDELRFLAPYLEIQQIRFDGRLQVQMNVEPDASNCLVPNLILQPLVENAIRHGIEPQSGEGRIVIEARRNGKFVWVRVCDNGQGLPGGSQEPIREGLGLSNTRSRLRHLYGHDCRLEISNALQGGAVVTLGIPWHAATGDSTPAELDTRREDSDPYCG
jgi:two-component system, LytTR family, sensor kinase